MPKSDDELRELFAKGREADRDAAPSFGATWSAADGSHARPVWPVAVAAAALVVVAGAWLVAGDGDARVAGPSPVAETSPLPDLPADEPRAEAEDAELLELAARVPTRLDAPTDFLLDDDGVLGGGLPTAVLNDPFLDFEDISTEL